MELGSSRDIGAYSGRIAGMADVVENVRYTLDLSSTLDTGYLSARILPCGGWLPTFDF